MCCCGGCGQAIKSGREALSDREQISEKLVKDIDEFVQEVGRDTGLLLAGAGDMVAAGLSMMVVLLVGLWCRCVADGGHPGPARGAGGAG